jgi:hypothetical protein
VEGVSTLGISRLSLENLGTKSHLCVSHVAKQRVYYKGEGGGFPPSLGHGEAVFACGLSVHQKCLDYALTKFLFGLCRSV